MRARYGRIVAAITPIATAAATANNILARMKATISTPRTANSLNKALLMNNFAASWFREPVVDPVCSQCVPPVNC